jgi:hypothetical protein
MSRQERDASCPCAAGRHPVSLPVHVHVNSRGRLFTEPWPVAPRAPDALEEPPASLPLF